VVAKGSKGTGACHIEQTNESPLYVHLGIKRGGRCSCAWTASCLLISFISFLSPVISVPVGEGGADVKSEGRGDLRVDLPGSHLDLLKSGRSMFLCITSTCPFTVPSFPLEKADVQSRMEMGSYQYNVGLHSDDCWAILLSVTWRTLSVLSVLFLGKLESASHGLWLRRSIQLGIPWKHRFAWEGRGGTGQRNAVIDRQEMTRSTRAVQRNWRR